MRVGEKSRQYLAQNLKRHMHRHGIESQRRLARLADISPSQVAVIIRADVGATVDALEALAEVFGLEAWCLLVPPEKAEIADESSHEGKEARRLLRLYARATPEGRRLILEIAALQPSALPDVDA